MLCLKLVIMSATLDKVQFLSNQNLFRARPAEIDVSVMCFQIKLYVLYDNICCNGDMLMFSTLWPLLDDTIYKLLTILLLYKTVYVQLILHVLLYELIKRFNKI